MCDAVSGRVVRALTASDTERVITIDASRGGGERRHFFQKRLSAAAARPADFIHLGATAGGGLQGFAMARIVRGEFGRADAVAVLEAIGVDPDQRKRGLGQSLIEELCALAGRSGVHTIHSQVSWNDTDLLGFFKAVGFEMDPRIALERAVSELAETAGAEP
jgi:ribosomal protein S18 acetylase RimI-like enzyme